MQIENTSSHENLKARKTDRRKRTSRKIIFPLEMPDGRIIGEDRRTHPDRRANAFISKQTLFQEVTWDFIESLLQICPRRHLSPGDILLSPEKQNEYLFLISSGRLVVHLDSPDAEGGFAINAGEFTGDMSIIDGKLPSAYVVADQKTEVVAVHKDVFWESVTKDPTVARNMMAMFVDRIRHGNEAALEALERELRYEHLQKELQAAHDIQSSMLPTLPLLNKTTKIKAHAIMEAARDVGGDFFDALELDEKRIYVAVGDVSGKGMPASLFMVKTITLLRDSVYRGFELAEIASSVNNSLCENNESNMFTTVFIAILNTETGELEYISGGHNPILIGNQSKGYDYLEKTQGILMGVMPDFLFTVGKRMMKPGETLVLYTDGVTEAENTAQELFGDEPFQKLLGTLPAEEPEKLIASVRQILAEHAGKAPQSDDITLLALHYLNDN